MVIQNQEKVQLILTERRDWANKGSFCRCGTGDLIIWHRVDRHFIPYPKLKNKMGTRSRTQGKGVLWYLAVDMASECSL